jgi:hypothetical protein
MLETMRALVAAGFSLVPCDAKTKLPIGYLLPVKLDTQGNPVINHKTGRYQHSWKDYQQRLPTDAELRRWAGHEMRPAVVYGAVSGHAEVLDFDRTADGRCMFELWHEQARRTLPRLVAQLCIVRTPSGAFHVPSRCPDAQIPGSQVLAASYWMHPKDPRQDRTEVLIETRGEGGFALCPPGAGYSYQQGDHLQLPVLTPSERDLLLLLARQCTIGSPRPKPPRREPRLAVAGVAAHTPWERYNQQATTDRIIDLFVRHGWQDAGVDGAGRRVRRPGAASESSGTVGLATPGWFHCFSSNAAPFAAGHNYSPFQVLTLLEYGGDAQAAARALGTAERGTLAAQQTIVKHSALGALAYADPATTFRRLAGMPPGGRS